MDIETGGFLGVATVRFKASAIDDILTDEAKRLWGARTDLSDRGEWGRIFIVDRNKTIIASASHLFLGRAVDMEPVDRASKSNLYQ